MKLLSALYANIHYVIEISVHNSTREDELFAVTWTSLDEKGAAEMVLNYRLPTDAIISIKISSVELWESSACTIVCMSSFLPLLLHY